MRFYTVLSSLALVQSSIAGYVLEDDYNTENFFDMFDFFTAADPTNGFVKYVDQATAQSCGLIATKSKSIYMGVDHTNVTPSGRPSVRITSKKSYNQGLVILDLAHMPGGACGTWPAFWTVGPNWPYSGEIDILEGVNNQSVNAYTLHTTTGCAITNNGGFAGDIQTDNCDVNAPNQDRNVGCSIHDKAENTYGVGFNANNGGVFATEWTHTAISVYFFERSKIPADIKNGNPNPSSWGTPRALFQGACDIPAMFKNQQIVFDTTFCGDWAGAVWSTDTECSALAASCQAYVQDNPEAFVDSYWTVNSLKVYQQSSTGDGSSSVASSPEATSPTTSTPLSTSAYSPTSIRTSTSAPSPSRPAASTSDNPDTVTVTTTLYMTVTADTPSPEPSSSDPVYVTTTMYTTVPGPEPSTFATEVSSGDTTPAYTPPAATAGTGTATIAEAPTPTETPLTPAATDSPSDVTVSAIPWSWFTSNGAAVPSRFPRAETRQERKRSSRQGNNYRGHLRDHRRRRVVHRL